MQLPPPFLEQSLIKIVVTYAGSVRHERQHVVGITSLRWCELVGHERNSCHLRLQALGDITTDV